MDVERMELQVIVASTREGRKGGAVGAWFEGVARAHGLFDVRVVDLAEVDLPMFDEPGHPRLGKYEHEHTREWSRTVDAADAFVIVTPEYDHVPPASIVNALQYLVREWAYKPVGFASYGGVSAGTRGVQVVKQIAAALRMVPVVEAVAVPFFAQHLDRETGAFDPGEVQERAGLAMLDELHKLAGALRPLREGQPA